MAITPGEDLLGCILFYDYLKERRNSSDFHTYSFGKPDDFIKNHESVYPRILDNYATLKQDCFFTGNRFCFLCEELEDCSVCAVSVAHVTSFIGKIPPWRCRIKRILRKEKKKFLEKTGT
jgi:hypothetical protein